MTTKRPYRPLQRQVRRYHPDQLDPQVMVGPIFLRYPSNPWRQEDAMPRRRINGRWLSAKWASHVQWVSAISHRGSRRGDRRLNMKQKAAERCSLYRHTSCPF